MPVETRILLRQDTVANWTGKTLADGEIGYVNFGTDKGKFKIGDGATTWASLPYAPAGAAETAVVATTAGKLTSTVNINGVAFDGSGNITVPGAFYEDSNSSPGARNAKVTVKAGSTGPTSPVEGDVWISF